MSLRELVWAAEAQIEQAWNHTAALLAMLANANRDPKKGRAFKPSDFHPIHEAKSGGRHPLPKADVRLLKTVFIDSVEGRS